MLPLFMTYRLIGFISIVTIMRRDIVLTIYMHPALYLVPLNCLRLEHCIPLPKLNKEKPPFKHKQSTLPIAINESFATVKLRSELSLIKQLKVMVIKQQVTDIYSQRYSLVGNGRARRLKHS